MNDTAIPAEPSTFSEQDDRKHKGRFWLSFVIVAAAVVGAIIVGRHFMGGASQLAAAPRTPVVSVSEPLQEALESKLQFLGQFSAIEQVELRAQVGGTLIHIGFKDGDIVHKGDVLFIIDPTPYEIKLSQVTAQVANARARLELASRQLTRAQTLEKTDAGTPENVEQRSAEQQSAQAALDEAQALVRDARFDLDHCRITAPFTGRIGTHLVSIGNLISGNRGGGSSTTLLATLVSLNPIYLNFDMSEADYMTFLRAQKKQKSSIVNKAEVSLSDEKDFYRQGTLNFVDNTLDRSSGTIHARAIVPNNDLLLTPGAFARVRLAVSNAAPTLLVPDASVLTDQSDHVVLTVGSDDVVVAKKVQLGEIRNGLRVIRSGLEASDRVVVEGVPTTTPGSKVSPKNGPIRPASDEGRK
jgi:RND family efflux transporter MFP subunit